MKPVAGGSTSSAATEGPGMHAGNSDQMASDARPQKRNWNRWTPEEHALLAKLVQQLGGTRSWSAIAAHIPGRTGKQCRERWINHQDEEAKTGAWSAQEEFILASLHSQHGTQWSRIARQLPGRSDNTVKNCWNATWKCRTLKKPHSILWLYSAELKAGRRKEDAYKYALLRWELHVPGQQVLDVVGFWPSKQWPDLLLKLPPDELMTQQDPGMPLRISTRGLTYSKPSSIDGYASAEQAVQEGIAAVRGQHEIGNSDTSSQVHGGDVPQQPQRCQQQDNQAMQVVEVTANKDGGAPAAASSGAAPGAPPAAKSEPQMMQQVMATDMAQLMAAGGGTPWAFSFQDPAGAVMYAMPHGAADAAGALGAAQASINSGMPQMMFNGGMLAPQGVQILQQGQAQQWLPVMQQQQPALYMVNADGQMMQVMQQAPAAPMIMMMAPNGQLLPVQAMPQMQLQQMPQVESALPDGWVTGGGVLQPTGSNSGQQHGGSQTGVAPASTTPAANTGAPEQGQIISMDQLPAVLNGSAMLQAAAGLQAPQMTLIPAGMQLMGPAVGGTGQTGQDAILGATQVQLLANGQMMLQAVPAANTLDSSMLMAAGNNQGLVAAATAATAGAQMAGVTGVTPPGATQQVGAQSGSAATCQPTATPAATDCATPAPAVQQQQQSLGSAQPSSGGANENTAPAASAVVPETQDSGADAATPAVAHTAAAPSDQVVLDRATQQALLRQFLSSQGINAVLIE